MFKDLFSLNGRVALVTGGSRGIGKMIAAGFLAQGAAKVYITARKAGPCEATAKELSAAYDGECIALPIDISTVEGCDKLAGEFIKLEPKLDILVNNAGAAWGAEFDEFPESGWDKVMDLNVKSVFFLTKALAKPLRAAAIARTARQGHQHRLRRRHLRQPRRDLFLRREQGRRDPSDAAHGDETDQGQYQRHRDRAGRVQVGHEPRRARPFGRSRTSAFRRSVSAPTRIWRGSRSISPRARAIMWSATPSRSMAAWSTPMRGLRSRGNGAATPSVAHSPREGGVSSTPRAAHLVGRERFRN